MTKLIEILEGSGAGFLSAKIVRKGIRITLLLKLNTKDGGLKRWILFQNTS